MHYCNSSPQFLTFYRTRPQANDEQSYYYQQAMPEVMDKLQAVEQQRTETLRQCVNDAATTEQRLQPIKQRCLDGMLQAARSIDVDAVSSGYVSFANF